MCGRYAASTHPDKLIEIFEVDQIETGPGVGADGLAEWTRPRWNIAPTDQVPAVLERDRDDTAVRVLRGLRWGLVPSWAESPSRGAPLINARLETVDVKPSFRKAFASRRCLLPADGYYEWQPAQRQGRNYKQPYFLAPRSGLLVMAGLYEFWRDPTAVGTAQEWLISCAIITTRATDESGQVHDRMPVQVARQNWDAWLDPGLRQAAAARELLHLPEPGEMLVRPVSTKVNRVTNDGADLVDQIDLTAPGE